MASSSVSLTEAQQQSIIRPRTRQDVAEFCARLRSIQDMKESDVTDTLVMPLAQGEPTPLFVLSVYHPTLGKCVFYKMSSFLEAKEWGVAAVKKNLMVVVSHFQRED
jgi:hypothetical protein